ncbi:hypothetical protein B0J14DRAFT_640882 [Halenospora varia]|nr:hypothetical protein B0J14DRAFT_640882 [Halenospora varia]
MFTMPGDESESTSEPINMATPTKLNPEGHPQKSEKPTLSQLMAGSATVKVIVGTKRKEWILHENVIYHHSKYFIKAFQGNFREALKNKHNEPQKWSHYEPWCQPYALTDKLGIEELMDHTLDDYTNCRIVWLPDVDDVQFIYQNTVEYSVSRIFVVAETAKALINRSFDTKWWVTANGCNAFS